MTVTLLKVRAARYGSRGRPLECKGAVYYIFDNHHQIAALEEVATDRWLLRWTAGWSICCALFEGGEAAAVAWATAYAYPGLKPVCHGSGRPPREVTPVGTYGTCRACGGSYSVCQDGGLWQHRPRVA